MVGGGAWVDNSRRDAAATGRRGRLRYMVGRWFKLGELQELAFTAAHQRVARAALKARGLWRAEGHWLIARGETPRQPANQSTLHGVQASLRDASSPTHKPSMG